MSDYFDDAIHIRDDSHPERTLCLQSATGLNVIERGDERPDAGSGCWTCLGLDRHLPRAIALANNHQNEEA